jgi:hypothetical protein
MKIILYREDFGDGYARRQNPVKALFKNWGNFIGIPIEVRKIFESMHTGIGSSATCQTQRFFQYLRKILLKTLLHGRPVRLYLPTHKWCAPVSHF